MKKFIVAIVSAVVFTASIAQINNCSIPGYPGCTIEDFNQAMREKRQMDLMEQQVREQRRSNQLMQEQNQLLQQMQNSQPVMPQNYYQQQRMQRCLTMPLGTPGC